MQVAGRSTRTVLFSFASCLTALSALLAAPGGVRAEEQLVRIALSPDYVYHVDPKDALTSVQTYSKFVTDELNRNRGTPLRPTVDLAPPLKELQRSLADGRIDLAYVTGYEYIRMKREVGIHPLLQAVRTDGRAEETGLLIVRSGEPAKSIEELKGKTFVFQSQSSTVGYLWPEWLLCTQDLPSIPRFFGKTIQVTKEKSALYAVLLGEADVASISDKLITVLRDLNPGIMKRLRVIRRSPPFPLGVLVARPGFDPLLREHFVSCMCDDPAQTQKQKELLTFIKISGFRRASDASFDILRSHMEILEGHRRPSLDPVCGRRLVPEDAPASTQVGGDKLYFCSEACLQEYQSRRDRADVSSREGLLILGLSLGNMFEVDPRDVLAMTRKLLGATIEERGLVAVAEVYNDLDIMQCLLDSGRLSMVQLSAPGYVRLRQQTPVVPLSRGIAGGEDYRALLLSTHSSGIDSFEALRGKTLAVTRDPGSPVGFYLHYLLKNCGDLSQREFFESTLECPSGESTVKALSYGQADAALVRSNTYKVIQEMQPGLCKDLKILDDSKEPLLLGPTCHHPDLLPGIVMELREAMLKLHEKPQARALLQHFRVRRLVTVEDAGYDNLRRLMGVPKPK